MLIASRILLLVLIFLSAPMAGQSKKEKKEIKAQKETEQYQAMQRMLASGSYEFSAEWATSFQGRRISLVTNPNYLRMVNGQAMVYLPYYGVAHTSSAAFTNSGGIVFEGSVEDYQIKTNDKKKEITIVFRCRAQRENLDFTLTVYGSGVSRLNVNSSIRTSVNYDGNTSRSESQDVE